VADRGGAAYELGAGARSGVIFTPMRRRRGRRL
jgi:hypothetical protein